MSLRRRLVLATMVVVAVALVAADAGAYLALRSFLLDRAERDIVQVANESTKLMRSAEILRSTEEALRSGTPNAAYALFDPTGRLIGTAAVTGPDKAALPEPVLPEVTLIPPVETDGTQVPIDAPIERILTPAAGGGFEYLTIRLVTTDGSSIVISWPLRDAEATLRQLAIIEALVTLAIVVVVAVAATRLVRLALRPLARIEATAARIAGGDFGRRIAAVDERTEVGRLGVALNTMLGRIEAALAEREASEQRLRRLVTDASHELRTPLTSLRGYAELFRRGADQRPADLARAMRGIELESERMALLVEELLLLARLDEDQALPTADEDLVPVVQAAVDAARAVEPDRPLELRVPLSAFVRADAMRLRQVVDNLLANVRVHTPQGTPAMVTVRTINGRVILEVADTGPGMAETARTRAFERFFRADPSRSRDSGGSGLGLAIVAGIARAYGGDAAVESELGKGTRFIVEWPAAVGPA